MPVCTNDVWLWWQCVQMTCGCDDSVSNDVWLWWQCVKWRVTVMTVCTNDVWLWWQYVTNGVYNYDKYGDGNQQGPVYECPSKNNRITNKMWDSTN